MAIKLPSNQIVDDMVTRRRVTNPDETWTRDVPMEVQRRMFPKVTGIAHESDAGRGAVAMDLYGKVPIAGGMIVTEVVISVKSSRGKGRKHGRTAMLTTGTRSHIENIVEALMDDTREYPVIFVHENTENGQWAQTFFDAGKVLRAVAAMDCYKGNAGIPGVSWASGARGIPITIRETARKGTDNLYLQLNFNMGVLVTPKGESVNRMPGVTGLGLATQWRQVDSPKIEWSQE